jgi:hypothetical protein
MFNLFNALGTGQIPRGERLLYPSMVDLWLDAQPNSSLEVIRGDELASGIIVAICELSGLNSPLKWAVVPAPGALYIAKDKVSLPVPGFICGKIYDGFRAHADDSGNEFLFGKIQPDNILPENWNEDVPELIFLPASKDLTVIALRMDTVRRIIDPTNVDPFAVHLRTQVALLVGQPYNAKGFDQTRLGLGSSPLPLLPGGGQAPFTYVEMSAAQKSKIESEGADATEISAAELIRRQTRAFMELLYDFDFEKLKDVLGGVLDFKSPCLPGRLGDLFATSSNVKDTIAACSPLLMSAGLLGEYLQTLRPLDNNSAVNGRFQGLSVQGWMVPKKPHPKDPHGASKSFIVEEIQTFEELRDTVARIPMWVNCLAYGQSHPTGNPMYIAAFRELLEDIWTSDDSHISKETTVLRMLALCNEVIGKWFAYMKTLYLNKGDRPTRQMVYEHSLSLLRIPEDKVLADAKRNKPVPNQFSNQYREPVVLAQKGPAFTPKGNVQQPPVAQKKSAPPAQAQPPAKKQKPAVGAAVATPVLGVQLKDQLCLNHFAGLIGAGPPCSKQGCPRNHNFAPPPGGSKWPSSVLNDAEDAANRIGIKNPSLRDKVIAAIRPLR